MRSGPELHHSLAIIDGLIFWSDGDTENLRRGNVAAANVTVCSFQSDFAKTCDELAVWHHRLSQPDCAWHLIRTIDDIDIARGCGKTGLIMGWQNLRAIEDRLERLAFSYDAGVRIMQLTYNERNFVADGCTEDPDCGLSAFGRKAVDELNRLGIAIDLSHVGERACLEVIDRSETPVLITHANAKAVTNVARNKSDKVLKAIAARGGTVGASIHGFMCWDGNPRRRHTLGDYVKHINYLRDLVGIKCIALGTDFPSVSESYRATDVLDSTAARYPSVAQSYVGAFGNTLRARYPEDCNSPGDLINLTDALLVNDWLEDEIQALYGGNLIRALRGIWHAR